MTTPKTITKPETICTRFSRTNLDPTSVCNFIEWLCGMEPIIDFEQTQADRDPVETTWGWNAPRQRMAKLLWQLIYGDSNEEFFDQHFFYHDAVRGKETQTILAPIQERIRWVLEGAFHRQNDNRQIGQGDWGECWWLPKEQTDYVREQLRNVTADSDQ